MRSVLVCGGTCFYSGGWIDNMYYRYVGKSREGLHAGRTYRGRPANLDERLYADTVVVGERGKVFNVKQGEFVEVDLKDYERNRWF